MIRWKLKDVMAAKDITNKGLAEMTGLQPVSVSKLKNRRTPDRIDVDSLDKVCKALNCQPGELIEYVSDEAEEIESGLVKKIAV